MNDRDGVDDDNDDYGDGNVFIRQNATGESANHQIALSADY